MVCRFNGIWFQGPLFNEIDISPKAFFQFSPDSCIGEQRDRLPTSVKLHKDIHITVCGLFPTGKRAEQPCLLYGLR